MSLGAEDGLLVQDEIHRAAYHAGCQQAPENGAVSKDDPVLSQHEDHHGKDQQIYHAGDDRGADELEEDGVDPDGVLYGIEVGAGVVLLVNRGDGDLAHFSQAAAVVAQQRLQLELVAVGLDAEGFPHEIFGIDPEAGLGVLERRAGEELENFFRQIVSEAAAPGYFYGQGLEVPHAQNVVLGSFQEGFENFFDVNREMLAVRVHGHSAQKVLFVFQKIAEGRLHGSAFAFVLGMD